MCLGGEIPEILVCDAAAREVMLLMAIKLE